MNSQYNFIKTAVVVLSDLKNIFCRKSDSKKLEIIMRSGHCFVCSICGMTFTNKFKLNSHQRIHNNKKPFSCRHCDKEFKWLDNLKTHERIHTGDKPYQCSYCDKNFSDKSGLLQHERIHTGYRPFKCCHCDKTFSQSSNMKTHISNNHKDSKPVGCRKSGKTFACSKVLWNHEGTENQTNVAPSKCKNSGERQQERRKSHNFSKNSKKFSSPSTLGKHEILHSNEKPFSCSQCKKLFTTSKKLKIHETIHTGKKLFWCNTCYKPFFSKSDLRKHERIHTGKKPFSCIHCEKTFAQSGNMRTHEIKCTEKKTVPNHMEEDEGLETKSSVQANSNVHVKLRFSDGTVHLLPMQ